MRNTSPFGILCGNGASGGPGGGHFSDAADKSCSSYNANFSFYCRLQPSDHEVFSQSEFMRFLQAQVEKEIRHSEATVIERQRLQPSGFLLAYRAPKISGKIKITGSFDDEETFKLDITLNEESASVQNPPLELQTNRYQPAGDFHVIAFTDSKKAAEHFKKWGEICANYDKLLRCKLLEENFSARNLEEIVAYQWQAFDSLPPRIRELSRKIGADADYPDPVPAEYKKFAAAHYLNDAAWRMFTKFDSGLPVLNTISAAETAQIKLTPMRKNYPLKD